MRWAPIILLVSIPLGTFWLGARQPTPTAVGTARGRQVYIAEGCIHCHSQYIRPGTLDEELWGEPHHPEFARSQSPALIGNRRQGPDLQNIGLRRTREWHRLHLMEPRTVSPHSRMPSYAHLFLGPGAAGRGEALLDYLGSLGHEPAGDSSLAPPAAQLESANLP